MSVIRRIRPILGPPDESEDDNRVYIYPKEGAEGSIYVMLSDADGEEITLAKLTPRGVVVRGPEDILVGRITLSVEHF